MRQAARSMAIDELSDRRKFQYNFWMKFRDKLEKTKKIPSLQTPKPHYWFDISLGKSGIKISNICNTDENSIGIRIYISNKIADTMLPYLENKKEEIESALGESLLWNPNPNNRDKIISLLHSTDFNSSKKTDEAIDWLIEKSVKFRDVFSKIIKQAP